MTGRPAVAEAESEETGDEADDRKQYGLPRFLTLADGRRMDTRRGTIPKQSHFACGACGMSQDIRESVEATKQAAPVAVYTFQGHCPSCNAEKRIYGGRFFSALSKDSSGRLTSAENEWHDRRDTDLRDFWPRDQLPHTYMTHHANFALPKQGYTHWWKMFNARQLLVHSQLLQCASNGEGYSSDVRHQALGAIQQYLRNQNMFCIYDVGYDKLAPFFSNPNYAPKALALEKFRVPDPGPWQPQIGTRNGRGWPRMGKATLGHISCDYRWQ